MNTLAATVTVQQAAGKEWFPKMSYSPILSRSAPGCAFRLRVAHGRKVFVNGLVRVRGYVQKIVSVGGLNPVTNVTEYPNVLLRIRKIQCKDPHLQTAHPDALIINVLLKNLFKKRLSVSCARTIDWIKIPQWPFDVSTS